MNVELTEQEAKFIISSLEDEQSKWETSNTATAIIKNIINKLKKINE